MLQAIQKSPELYRPVFKTEDQEWQRLETPVQLNKENEQDIELIFDFTFKQPNQFTYFAFSYPFSYQEQQNILNLTEKQLAKDNSIYFHKEVLIKSVQKRNIDLITISSFDEQLQQQEESIDLNLFPEKNIKNRAKKYKSTKPVILISARVHPGETPSSYAMHGILKFLTSKKDARAMFLRKQFVILLVPMLNPDGVFSGHYRMDTLNQNLNRYYINPELDKQPSCYAIKRLFEFYSSSKNLFFYCDLHAHAGKKGCFFYGNAMDEYAMQIETQAFAKILSLNCINFEYDSCNFSKKQMSSKDKLENLTKEGCSRVIAYTSCKLIHSYTLECGFHCSNYLSELPYVNNVHRKFHQSGHNYQFVEDEIENVNSDLYKNGPPFYSPAIYENIGKNLLISILDIFDKNPYSRVENSQLRNIDGIRRDICLQVAKLERFKKEDNKLLQKQKQISEYIFESYYLSLFNQGCFVELQCKLPQNTKNQKNVQQISYLSELNQKKQKIFKAKKNILEKDNQNQLNFNNKTQDISEAAKSECRTQNLIDLSQDNQIMQHRQCDQYQQSKNVISLNDFIEEIIQRESQYKVLQNLPLVSYENISPAKLNKYKQNICHQVPKITNLNNNKQKAIKQPIQLTCIQYQIKKKLTSNSIKTALSQKYEFNNNNLTNLQELAQQKSLKFPEIVHQNLLLNLQHQNSAKHLLAKTPNKDSKKNLNQKDNSSKLMLTKSIASSQQQSEIFRASYSKQQLGVKQLI